MLGHLRPMLRLSVPLLAACIVATPSIAVAAPAGFAAPRVIMAPRYVPRLLPRPVIGQHGLRRGAHLRRFPLRRPVIGIDSGVGGYPVPVPVPTGGGEPQGGSAPPSEASYPGDYRGGVRAPAAAPSGPQIIVLPDAPRGARRAGRSAAATPAYGAPVATPWRRHAHRRYRAPYAGLTPRYAYPVYAYRPSPVALFPCGDTPYAPIYNTPCGPYR